MIPADPVIVVTGASRGIGRAIALRFAKKGYRMAIACHNNSGMLDEVCHNIINYGAECLTYTGDLSDPSDVNELFENVYSQFGTVDVLINNAGISYIGLLSEMSDDDWNNVISTNLNSVFYCCRRVIPGMVHTKNGSILNISSVWGNTGASCEVAYSASKGAVNAFTKALAKELAPSNIQVNAVACGLIDTTMNDHLSVDELEALYEDIPAGRSCTVSEVADAVYSICSQSSYLTGQVITIDGGWI